MEKKFLSVFNPSTGQYENVEVTEEFYHAYRRMNWRKEKREQKYQSWFIPFSSLKGGLNGAFQNFHEFITNVNHPEHIMDANGEKRCLYKALKALEEDELKLIFYLFYKDMTEEECADVFGNTQQAISKRKTRLLYKIAELMKKFEE
ncbi:MAG: sigma-70 family RNA polymerase sigma factor [Oscillospiraceae bacterium]|nr:sigma-70 family RNA polymerase sigma factor [Oscillospiraceae bacterium]